MINCSHLSVSPTKSTEWPVEGLRGRAGEQLQHRSGSNMSGTSSRAHRSGAIMEAESPMASPRKRTDYDHLSSSYPQKEFLSWYQTKMDQEMRERCNAHSSLPCYLQRCVHLPWISQLPYSLCRKKKHKPLPTKANNFLWALVSTFPSSSKACASYLSSLFLPPFPFYCHICFTTMILKFVAQKALSLRSR